MNRIPSASSSLKGPTDGGVLTQLLNPALNVACKQHNIGHLTPTVLSALEDIEKEVWVQMCDGQISRDGL